MLDEKVSFSLSERIAVNIANGVIEVGMRGFGRKYHSNAFFVEAVDGIRADAIIWKAMSQVVANPLLRKFAMMRYAPKGALIKLQALLSSSARKDDYDIPHGVIF
jgi:hypothetical protein